MRAHDKCICATLLWSAHTVIQCVQYTVRGSLMFLKYNTACTCANKHSLTLSCLAMPGVSWSTRLHRSLSLCEHTFQWPSAYFSNVYRRETTLMYKVTLLFVCFLLGLFPKGRVFMLNRPTVQHVIKGNWVEKQSSLHPAAKHAFPLRAVVARVGLLNTLFTTTWQQTSHFEYDLKKCGWEKQRTRGKQISWQEDC